MRKFLALLITSTATLTILSAGCSAAKAADNNTNNTMIPASVPALESQNLAGTSWVLVSYGASANLTAALSQVKVTLNFSDDTTTINGNGGVNSYGGDCTRTDNQLTISGIIHTEMASIDQAVNIQENTYFEILSTAQSISFSNDALTINCAGDRVLEFAAAKADNPTLNNTMIPATTDITPPDGTGKAGGTSTSTVTVSTVTINPADTATGPTSID